MEYCLTADMMPIGRAMERDTRNVNPMTRTVTGNALAMMSRAREPGYNREGPQSPRMTPLNHLKNLRYHGRSNPQALMRRWMSAFLIRGFSIKAANGFGTREKICLLYTSPSPTRLGMISY